MTDSSWCRSATISPDPPLRAPTPLPHQPGGLGLFVADALATNWSYVLDPADGKSVYFTLSKAEPGHPGT
jgi:hypothetical protein